MTPEALSPTVTAHDAPTGRVGRRLSRELNARLSITSFTALGIGDLDVFSFRTEGGVLRLNSTTADPLLLLVRAPQAPLVVTREGRPPLQVLPDDVAQILVIPGIALHLPADQELTGVMLPAESISEFRRLGAPAIRRAISNQVLITPIWSFLDSVLVTTPPWSNLSSYFVENLLSAMLASIVIPGATEDMPNDETTRIAAPRLLVQGARNHLIAYARDPRLTSQSIADNLGVSLRSLQRAFTSTGSTLGREIRQARATAAISLLRSPEGQVLTLDEVARLSGYPDAVALRRAFQALGLAQPSSYRYSTEAAEDEAASA